MSTIANSKNGYSLRLEILQMGSSQSRVTLDSVFLSKTSNYCLQIERFVINSTPVINLIEGPYMEIFALPVAGAGGVNFTLIGDPIVNGSFGPDNPKTVLEVMYQLNEFSKEHEGFGVRFEPGFEITFTMSRAFGQTHFLKLHPDFARLLGVPRYIFHFFNFAGTGDSTSVHPQTADNINLLFHTTAQLAGTAFADNDSESVMKGVENTIVTTGLTWRSQRSLKALDTRLEYDIMCTVNTDSKIEVFNGVESRKKFIARFPIGETIVRHDTLTVDSNQNSVSEIVNVGLEDLCRKNVDTQTLILMNGEVLILNTKIECRYMDDKKIVTRAAGLDDNGFFYLQLLFSKRLK